MTITLLLSGKNNGNNTLKHLQLQVLFSYLKGVDINGNFQRTFQVQRPSQKQLRQPILHLLFRSFQQRKTSQRPNRSTAYCRVCLCSSVVRSNRTASLARLSIHRKWKRACTLASAFLLTPRPTESGDDFIRFSRNLDVTFADLRQRLCSDSPQRQRRSPRLVSVNAG